MDEPWATCLNAVSDSELSHWRCSFPLKEPDPLRTEEQLQKQKTLETGTSGFKIVKGSGFWLSDSWRKEWTHKLSCDQLCHLPCGLN